MDLVVPDLHGAALLPLNDPAEDEHLAAHHSAAGLLPGGEQQRVLRPGVAGDVVGQTVVPDVAVRVSASTQEDLLTERVCHGPGPGHLQLEVVWLHHGVADVVCDEDVDGLPAREEVLTGVSPTNDDSREGLLPALDAAAISLFIQIILLMLIIGLSV